MKRQTQQQNQTTLSANRCYFCDGIFSVPNIPKVLPCLHILCRDCITSIIHSQQIKFKNNDENSIYCPLCKCFIPLPPNYMSVLPTPYNKIKRVFDSSFCNNTSTCKESAFGYCFDCNMYFCLQHASIHHMKRHEIEIFRREKFCLIHMRNSDLYCYDCRSIICSKCKYEYHREHQITPLSFFYSFYMKKLNLPMLNNQLRKYSNDIMKVVCLYKVVDEDEEIIEQMLNKMNNKYGNIYPYNDYDHYTNSYRFNGINSLGNYNNYGGYNIDGLNYRSNSPFGNYYNNGFFSNVNERGNTFEENEAMNENINETEKEVIILPINTVKTLTYDDYTSSLFSISTEIEVIPLSTLPKPSGVSYSKYALPSLSMQQYNEQFKQPQPLLRRSKISSILSSHLNNYNNNQTNTQTNTTNINQNNSVDNNTLNNNNLNMNQNQLDKLPQIIQMSVESISNASNNQNGLNNSNINETNSFTQIKQQMESITNELKDIQSVEEIQPDEEGGILHVEVNETSIILSGKKEGDVLLRISNGGIEIDQSPKRIRIAPPLQIISTNVTSDKKPVVIESFCSINGGFAIVDSGNDFVKLISKSFNLFGGSGNGKGQFNQPHGICVGNIGKDETIFVVDSNNHRVQSFLKGRYVRTYPRDGKTILKSPHSCTYLQKEHQLYVTDTENNRIAVFTSDGTFIKSIAKDFNKPTDIKTICINNQYFLIMCDTGNNRVIIMNKSGGIGLTRGDVGEIKKGKFLHPKMIAIDQKRQQIYIGEGNKRLQKFDFELRYLRSYDLQMGDITAIFYDQVQDVLAVSGKNNDDIQLFSQDLLQYYSY